MSYTSEDGERIQGYIDVHLRSKADLPDDEKIKELEKKLRSKMGQLIFNVLIMVIILFAFINDLTTFGPVFYYILLLFFF